MENLRRAMYALQTAASKHKKIDEATQGSIAQLPAVLKLLELTKTSGNVYHRLGSLLRPRTVPIYTLFPALGLRYFVAVLTFISDEKIAPAVESRDAGTTASWEGVQAALVSGVLDFLEAHASEIARGAVAAAVYSTLLDNYLPSNPSSISEIRSDLLLAVYQLLLETVTSSPVNQRKLRDQEVLGGRRIGMVLSCSKDFLVIEALLQLFAKLLPPVAGGREKRTEFINQVFHPTTFSTSHEIIELLNSISSTDWDVTSLKIMDVLAEADIGSPQPFGTEEICVNGSITYTIDRIYVDHTALTANIEQEGQLETFQSPYSNINKIRLSAPFHSKTNVTVYLSSSPILGNTPLDGPSTKEATLQLSFQLEGKEVGRFVQALKYRGLADIISELERKVSKAEAHVNLNFNSHERIPPISTQEKVQNIANLWNYHDTPGHVEPTSPLVASHQEAADFPPRQPLELKDLDILNQYSAGPRLPKVRSAGGHESAAPPTKLLEVDEDINISNSDNVSGQATHSKPIAKTPVMDAKRKRPQVIVIDDEDDAPPSKRRNERGHAKIAVLDTAAVIPAAGDTRSTKRQTRYGGKTRTSSPRPMMDIDETLPKSAGSRQGVSDPPKGKVTAMKGRGGKATKTAVRNKARKAKANHRAPAPPPEHTVGARSPSPPMPTSEPKTEQRDVQMDSAPDEIMTHETRLAPWDDPVFMNKSRGRTIEKLGIDQEHTIPRAASPRFDEKHSKSPIPKAESTQRHLDPSTKETIGKESRNPPSPPSPVAAMIGSTNSGLVRTPLFEKHQQECLQKLASAISVSSPPQNQSSPKRRRTSYLAVPKSSALLHRPRTQQIPPAYTPNRGLRRRTRGLGGLDTEAGYAEDRIQEGRRTRSTPKENYIPRIIETIKEITQVIIDKVSQRFEKVEDDMYVGRMTILQGTADELVKMRLESVDHFNKFIDRELDYTSYHREVVNGLEELGKATTDISNTINDIIKNHDRDSLSKKFPTSLLPTPLPAIFSGPLSSLLRSD